MTETQRHRKCDRITDRRTETKPKVPLELRSKGTKKGGEEEGAEDEKKSGCEVG